MRKITEKAIEDGVKELLFKLFKTDSLETIIAIDKNVSEKHEFDNVQKFIDFIKNNPNSKIVHSHNLAGKDGSTIINVNLYKNVDYKLEKLFEEIVLEIKKKTVWQT